MPLPRLVVHLASGQLHEVPPDDEWLSAVELDVVTRLKLEKRRLDWRLGRWLARQAVRDALAAAAAPGQEPALASLAIVAAEGGAPEVRGVNPPVSISISHRHGRGLAAATLGDVPIGCDVELVEERSERFVRDWLTPAESEHVLEAPRELWPRFANLCWSAKEAASKVLRVGLRFDTRSFEVALPDADAAEQAAGTGAWLPIEVRAVKTGDRFEGVWRARGDFVETVVAGTVFEIREQGQPATGPTYS